MSTAPYQASGRITAQVPPGNSPPMKLHHIADVRRQQGVSLRSAARRMKLELGKVRESERPDHDMLLSMLYRWQDALEVPVADLLIERDDPLSQPIKTRAHLVRVMKTVMAIREKANDQMLQRLADMLVDQLTQIMPELAEVSPWHTVGQRRSLDEWGRIGEQTVSDDWLFNPGH